MGKTTTTNYAKFNTKVADLIGQDIDCSES